MVSIVQLSWQVNSRNYCQLHCMSIKNIKLARNGPNCFRENPKSEAKKIKLNILKAYCELRKDLKLIWKIYKQTFILIWWAPEIAHPFRILVLFRYQNFVVIGPFSSACTNMGILLGSWRIGDIGNVAQVESLAFRVDSWNFLIFHSTHICHITRIWH